MNPVTYLTYLRGIALLLYILHVSACSDPAPRQRPDAASPDPEPELRKAWEDRAEEGLDVFALHCEACHTAPHKTIWDGTRWRGMFERFPDGEKYLLDFISSSSALRNDSDWYALEIKEEYGNPDYEHEFADSLSREELMNLMVYLKQEIDKHSR